MPVKRDWTDAENTRLRQMRAEGASWTAIGVEFGVVSTTAGEQGARIGARPPPPDFIPETIHRDQRRTALPAGHPDTWGRLIAGTVLEGSPYEYRAAR